MNILVVQTTRMGDMLQTSPLIRMIRYQYPDARITAMVRGMGKIIAERHPDVDDVIVYNEDAMFLDMRARDSRRLLRAYRHADSIVTDLRARRFDLAYNTTHSVASAMLLRMAGIPRVIGADIGEQGEFVLRGRWVNYFFTSVMNRDYNDLNLCDITRHFAEGAQPCRELIFEMREEDRAFAESFWKEHDIQPGDFVACMQLGASELNKRWSQERFAELGRMLRDDRRARILLVGVNEEAPLGEAFERHAPGVAIHLYGKTSVPQLAALLERASVLITNDTGTMHIAAAVKCPIVLVSVGHVHYRETGPFGEGHAAIERRKERLGRSDQLHAQLEEQSSITAEQVRLVMDHVLERTVQSLADSPVLKEVDVYTTRFAPDGCLEFYPAIRRPLEERDLVRMAYRAMWLEHLGALPEPGANLSSLRTMLAAFLIPDKHMMSQQCRALALDFGELARIAKLGVEGSQALTDSLRASKFQQARQQVQHLMALDEQARLHSELHPACRPLAMMARFERDNLEGADAMHLAAVTLAIYEACSDRAEGMARALDLIARMLEESTPN